MHFGPVPLEKAIGKILGHNIAGRDGKRIFRKGKQISPEDIPVLAELGKTSVYVAELDSSDVGEDQAALRIARAVTRGGFRLSGPSAGRVNLLAEVQGVLRVDSSKLLQVNIHEGTTLATLPAHQVVQPRQIVGTVKIIPYAVAGEVLAQIEKDITTGNPLMSIDELSQKRVATLLSGSVSIRERLIRDFDIPLRMRIESFGSTAGLTGFISLEEESDEIELSAVLEKTIAAGFEMIIIAGETAIMDRFDLVPRAVERAGGFVETVGVPIDPGNLLMLGYIQDVPILGAPGCARSLKTNALDWILPRLLVGEHLTYADLAALGYGGLLEDTTKRPRPRSRLKTQPARPKAELTHFDKLQTNWEVHKMKTITIQAGSLTLQAQLNDGPTSLQIWDALPIEGRASRWGDEIYFEVPVKASQEPDAREEVDVGELGYWPVGNAFCIFFGPTPVSTGKRPRAYSPVNILGKVNGDATLFRQVKNGELVLLDRFGEG